MKSHGTLAGEQKTVTFTKRPLGVSCSMDTMPIVVGEPPRGAAAEAGVCEGWILCQVGTDPSNMRSCGCRVWVADRQIVASVACVFLTAAAALAEEFSTLGRRAVCSCAGLGVFNTRCFEHHADHALQGLSVLQDGLSGASARRPSSSSGSSRRIFRRPKGVRIRLVSFSLWTWLRVAIVLVYLWRMPTQICQGCLAGAILMFLSSEASHGWPLGRSAGVPEYRHVFHPSLPCRGLSCCYTVSAALSGLGVTPDFSRQAARIHH